MAKPDDQPRPECPGHELLRDFAFKVVDAAAQAVIEAHIAACADCRSEVKVVKQLHDCLASKPVAAAGEPCTCPDLEALGRFVDGSLDGATRGEFEKHLIDCRPCRERLIVLYRDAALAIDPSVDVPMVERHAAGERVQLPDLRGARADESKDGPRDAEAGAGLDEDRKRRYSSGQS